jgi:hypothetical protein
VTGASATPLACKQRPTAYRSQPSAGGLPALLQTALPRPDPAAVTVVQLLLLRSIARAGGVIGAAAAQLAHKRQHTQSRSQPLKVEQHVLWQMGLSAADPAVVAAAEGRIVLAARVSGGAAAPLARSQRLTACRSQLPMVALHALPVMVLSNRSLAVEAAVVPQLVP